MSRPVPKKPVLQSTGALRILSLLFHSALVALHLVRISIWAAALEHRVIFSLDNQKIASLLITGISTTFGTIYSAVLVFVTQTLATRRSLQMDQPLTATHDNAAAWAGIGSAILHLWHQKTVPASTIGVLSAFFYLANILVLHITTPALFSLQTFDSYLPVTVTTQGLPSLNSAYNLSESRFDSLTTVSSAFWWPMSDYSRGSLKFFPSVVGSTTNPGLYGSTLYDVPVNITEGAGNISVSGMGFNITCGYLSSGDMQFSVDDGGWLGKLPGQKDFEFGIASTQPGIISRVTPLVNSTMDGLGSMMDAMLLYSTIPIVDSNDSSSSWFNLVPPMNTSVSAIQVFQCSLALLAQTATLDAQTQKILTVQPELQKTASAWGPYSGHSDNGSIDGVTGGNPFIDLWAYWYNTMPPSEFELVWGSGTFLASVADVYLIQQLNLPAANHSDTRIVTLHDLENALSTIVASMFWTLGHLPPTHISIPAGMALPNGTVQSQGINDVPNPPELLQGNATVTQVLTKARLDLSIIAITAGLVASIALALLSLSYSLFHGGIGDDSDLPIHGTGILHAIWLYRNHPELETILEQVEDPTDANLRQAGMIRTRLVGGRLRKHKSCESF
ncbi:hypothetical protein B0H17DRAFT_1173615 [Mycena rosella]|uniref:Uncharacterized protein n=1 Tax=Mycena rosella TaxID=1033263 RepID=A0AAD7MCQ7_MYCRO|nr:hypothetical protein B0H17DRAFT_1173615 [Mycena rosella]